MTLTAQRDRPGGAPAAGLRGVARGGLLNLAGAGVAGLSGVVVTWLVARALGPAHAGAFFAATAAFVLAGGVAKLGSQTSLVYWPARLRARDQARLLGACLRIGLTPVAVAGVLLAVALWVAAPALAGIGGSGTDTAEFAGQLRMLAVFLPLAALSDSLLAATRGYRTMRPTVLLDRVARPMLQVAGVGALALATLWAAVPVSAYPIAWAAPYLPVVVLAAAALWRAHVLTAAESRAATPAEVSGLRRRFWGFAWPRAMASVAQLALQRLDVLLVAALAGLAAAALYTVASRFIVLGQFANQAISQAVQPRLAERLSTGDNAEASALYQVATGWLVLATWPLYLLVIVYAPVYLSVFGDAYRTGGVIVVVLACAMLVATGCGMVDMVLAMAGKTTWNLANVALALGITIGLDLALIPRYGALGAAIGLAVAVLVNNLVPLVQVGRAVGVHPFGRGTLAAGGLALGCFGAVPLAMASLLGTGPLGLVASIGCGGAAYVSGALRLRRTLALDAFPIKLHKGGS